MANIMIRNIDDTDKQHLRMIAARNGRSMEAEAQDMLHTLIQTRYARPRNIGIAFYEAFQALGGVDLELPLREEA